jgi:hypothetical protein
MKTYLPLGLILWLAACASPAAQDKTANKDTTATAAAITTDTTSSEDVYDSYARYDTTFPPYGLEKVKALIAKIKFVDDPEGGDMGTSALSDKNYASLSFKEKFTYHIIHPESFSQNCDILPLHPKEDERIYATLPDIFGEQDWSERQLNFFKNNRDSVALLMRSVIEKNKHVGTNFKEAIVEMNGTQLIPVLIDTYKQDKKDHYILTVLLLLMNYNKYPEFVNSTGYKKLYGVEPDREDINNAPHLVYNKANEDLIIQRATNFYNGLQAK